MFDFYHLYSELARIEGKDPTPKQITKYFSNARFKFPRIAKKIFVKKIIFRGDSRPHYCGNSSQLLEFIELLKPSHSSINPLSEYIRKAFVRFYSGDPTLTLEIEANSHRNDPLRQILRADLQAGLFDHVTVPAIAPTEASDAATEPEEDFDMVDSAVDDSTVDMEMDNEAGPAPIPQPAGTWAGAGGAFGGNGNVGLDLMEHRVDRLVELGKAGFKVSEADFAPFARALIQMYTAPSFQQTTQNTPAAKTTLGCLYCVMNPNKTTEVKIGVSSKFTPEDRIRSFNTSASVPWECLFSVPTHEFMALEKFVHKALKNMGRHVEREMFVLDRNGAFLLYQTIMTYFDSDGTLVNHRMQMPLQIIATLTPPVRNLLLR